MNIFLIDAVPSGVSGSERTCVPGTLTGNWQALYDRVCLRSGNVGAFNPFRTVHEIGHGVMRRWMNTTVNNSRGCDATDWDSGNNESSATSEAFANFFAVAAWWNSDMTGMEYDGHDAMNKGDVDLTGTCGAGNNCTCTEGKLNGEGRPTQFFVDLWQSGGETELRTQDILRVWSTFDREIEAYECGPDGRNLEDFRSAYSEIRASYGWASMSDFDSTLSYNCTNRHRNGQSACDCDLCEHDKIGVGPGSDCGN